VQIFKYYYCINQWEKGRGESIEKYLGIFVAVVLAITAYILFLGALDESSPLNLPQNFAETFSAIGGVPHPTGHNISSVTSLYQLNETIQNNSTTNTFPITYHFTISNLAALPSTLNVTHTPNIAIENRNCFVNLHFIGSLSDANMDSLSLASGILQNGVNEVTCQ